MGKNRDIESLIRLIANTIVHEIVVRHTNRPESRHFLSSEIVEYRSQAERAVKKHNWNDEDKAYISKNALAKIKEKLSAKYPDVKYPKPEITSRLKELIKDILP